MRKRILIIDDDMGIIDGLTTILEDEGYQVSHALNGRHGLDYLNQNGDIQLILLDLMMPVMDGYAFLEEYSRSPHLTDIPVIVLTAGLIERKRAEDLGMRAYFSKPIDINSLMDKVNVYF